MTNSTFLLVYAGSLGGGVTEVVNLSFDCGADAPPWAFNAWFRVGRMGIMRVAFVLASILITLSSQSKSSQTIA
jgi:hypothetical protein